MKKYIGTKIIKAKSMTLGEYNNIKGWTIPKDENPNKEGYIVEYSDNYISWSPKDAFEESYRPIVEMNFGIAIEALKKGYKVSRKGWNSKGMYVYYVPENSYIAMTENAKKDFGDIVPYNAYLAIKNANGTVSTWVPSINDCLAEDWGIVI